MKLEKISLTPDPYAAYYISQGTVVGDLLFVSGQTAINDDGELIGVGDFDQQIEKVFSNLEKVLAAGKSSLSQVAKVTIFLTDMTHFDKVVEYRKKYFTEPYPADTIVEVNSLFHSDVLLEIEAIALRQ